MIGAPGKIRTCDLRLRKPRGSAGIPGGYVRDATEIRSGWHGRVTPPEPKPGHPDMKPLETRAIRGHAMPRTGTFGPHWDQTGPDRDQSKESAR